MTSSLSGSEKEQLSIALLDAFRTEDVLRRLLSYKLSLNLDRFTFGSLENRVFQIIDTAEAKGWLRELVHVAHADSPGNFLLHQFFEQYETSPQRSVTGAELERIVSKARGFINPAVWRSKLEEVEARVCRIELAPDYAIGTGFLVSPDVILTNYHVIEGKQLDSLQVRFDHKVLADQSTIQSGTVYPVRKCIEKSPYSLVDTQMPKPSLPTLQELDYALLQVGGSPGEQQLAGRVRGWIALPDQDHSFTTDSLVVIVQHPSQQPMKVAFDSLIDINENRTRITYKTNTEPGSSGSPCFDETWKLIAIHHSGDPRLYVSASFNEGIPAATICQNLSREVRKLFKWT